MVCSDEGFLRWLSLVDDPLSLASIIDPYILLMDHVRPIFSASQVRSDAVVETKDVAARKAPSGSNLSVPPLLEMLLAHPI